MLSGGAVQINVRMNYGQNGGDTTLSGINVGSFPTVHPGDILVTSGGNRWAIPLVTHNDFTVGMAGLDAGNLYSVSGFLTSGTVLNNTSAGTYRPAEFVWGESTGAIKKNTGAGSVAATLLGGSEINVAINFTSADTNFLEAFSGSGSYVQFAAATCANDLVAGNPVPEPMSLSLIGAGLLGLGLLKRKRSKNC
ncbi:MAG: PEP-CTERM sorting domain-containing protein [Bryobacterales bacterium]|nr:PEP-CTERM sorting domain-containing protein [Bryobacterales bacterium]